MTKLTQALLCVLALTILIGGSAFYGSSTERERALAFKSGSATTQGIIVNRRLITNSDQPTYIIELQFIAPDKITRNSSVTVSQAVYDSFHNGDPIKITYVKANPMKFYLPGDEPKLASTEWSTAVVSFCAVAGMASLVGVILSLVNVHRQRGETQNSDEMEPLPVKQRRPPPPSPKTEGPRATFGVRRSRA